MLDLLYYWWAVGFASCIAAGTYINRETVNVKDFLFILIASIALGLLGPVIAVLIMKWFWEGWRDSLPVDDDGKRDWPWQKD